MQAPSINWQGRMLGRYRLLRLLGRGGMGEVWLADDMQLRRQVAIKMLPVVYAEDRNYLQAFMQEARTAASLEHPHILPVHDFGEEKIEGGEVITYLVMPHIGGGSLRERLKSVQGSFPMGEGLRYLRQAAQAIDYAHSKQVLHRDIKPANMLLQQDWLLLADFGIAKILNETKRSRTHAGAGTPEYMAPEQAQGHAIGASDLYSLAIIAYQMLTGSVPFRGKTPYDTLIMQITASPEPSRNRQSSISPIVEAIVLRGLAKQAVQRQPGCTVFVDELEKALQGSQALLPNMAASQEEGDPDATVLAPWKKQPPGLAAVNLQPYNAPSATPLPPTMQAGIVGPQTQPSQPQPSTWPGVSQPVSGGSYPRVSGEAGMYPVGPEKGMYPVSGSGANYARPASYPGMSTYPPLPNQINYPAAGYSPTQMSGIGNAEFRHTQAEISGINPVSGGPIPGMLTGVPAQKSKIGRRQLLVGGAAAVVLIGGGTILASSMLHKSIVPGNHGQGQPKMQAGPQELIKGIARLVLSGHNDGVTMALWHPQGRYLVSAGQDGNIMQWDIESYLKKSSSLQTISTPMNKWKFTDQVYRGNMSWSADGKMVAVAIAGEENKIHIIEPFSNTSVQSYSKPADNAILGDTFDGLAWSPVENTLAGTIFFQGDITLFDGKHAGSVVKALKSNDLNPKTNQAYDTNVPSWSKDGRYLAGQTANFKALIWDVKSGNIVQSLDFPARTDKNFVITTSIQQWSPKIANQLAVVNLDAVQIWDALNNKLLLTFGTNDAGPLTIPPNPPEGWVPHMLGLAWSPNGRYLAGGYARSNLIYVWDTKNPVPSTSKDNLHVQNMYFGSNGHSAAISNLAWSPDGRYIATTSSDKTVIIWQVDGK